MYREAAKEILGKEKKQSKQWISDITWKKIKERKDEKQKLENTKSILKQRREAAYKAKNMEVERRYRALRGTDDDEDIDEEHNIFLDVYREAAKKMLEKEKKQIILEMMSNSDDLFIAQNTFDIIPLPNFDIDDLLSDLELRMPLPANNDDKVCRWEKMRKISIVFDVKLARKNTREGFKKEQTKVPNGRLYVLG
ncbi:hypothetical protein AC249_AIPGENE10674 [Exaiptasia diaphana]|nr:hypothetical protein AC249_AIPGENE10674 [Exaiptasia diaphana]